MDGRINYMLFTNEAHDDVSFILAIIHHIFDRH